jgi:Phosphoserine phosphatase RsbU, N-terminal domain/GAF domain
VSAGANTGPGSFPAAYFAAFRSYLLEPGERTLRAAYELGREAVGRKLSVLDLAVAHHEALVSVLADVSTPGESQEVARAAGNFFLESLSSYEMVQRGFSEARETASLERRQTRLSRQLSTFLADASLALDASDSLDEMLQLVAEQARELVGAECCVATVAAEGRPRIAEAASYAQADRQWMGLVQWLDLFGIYRLIRASGGSVRVAGEQLAQLAPFRTAASDRSLAGWLAASLTALDGSELGALQLFDKQDGDFTPEDEAALVHLAQMASAAVERARSYQERS